MSARILDGKRIADELLDGLKARIDARMAAGGSRPGLAVVLVGGDPASQSYVRNKRRAAEVAFVDEFGKQGQPARPFIQTANEKAADPAIDAAARVYDDFLKSKNF